MATAPPRADRAHAHGFTLVELLVALMVMALLSLMSWRGLDAMGRAQSQTQARADDLMALQSGLAQWSADLDAMANELGNSVNNPALPSPLDWNGLVLRITRYSSGAGEPGLRVVAWSSGTDRGRKVWLRWQSPVLRTRTALQDAWLQAAVWGQSPNEDSREHQVSITPLAEWDLFYYRGGAWSNPGSSSDTTNATPEGVRLLLTLPEGQPLVGTISRDWMRPNVVATKS